MTTARPDDGWTTTLKLAWIEQLAVDPGISALALRLALILATKYVNRATGEAWPAQDTLAEDIGGTADGLRKAARQLEERGHLGVERSPGRGRSNRYRPLIKASNQIQNPRRASGFPGNNTPTPVVENPDARHVKTPTRVGLIPLEEPLEEPLERTRRKPATAIPDGFPDQGMIEREQFFLREKGWNIDACLEAEKFRAYSLDKGRTGKDWAAGFHGWIVKAIEFAPPTARIAPKADTPRVSAPPPWRARLKAFADPRNGYWNDSDWGPRPGKPECKVPAGIAAEFIPDPSGKVVPIGRAAHG